MRRTTSTTTRRVILLVAALSSAGVCGCSEAPRPKLTLTDGSVAPAARDSLPPATPAIDSGADTAPAPDSGPSGLSLLGNGTHAASAVTITVVASAADGLATPRDLAFHPDNAGQLWVVNEADHSVVVLSDVTNNGAGAGSAVKRRTLTGAHFLPRPAGIAFGRDFVGWSGKRNFATIHETDKKTQSSTPADFMGPTLFTSDMSVFDGGHSGHIDMLHNSPNGMGIAWERDNVYWVFDGAHGAISRYDFGKDHGPGNTYHGDGSVRRYVAGSVKRVAGVPSHLEIDATSKLLYIADTGNNRIAVLDTSTGQKSASIAPNYDGGEQVSISGADIKTLVDAGALGMKAPSGLALHGGTLYVSDNATSRVWAFDLQGNALDWLDLQRPAGALMGLALGADGALYVVDATANEVLRIRAKQ